MNEELTNDEVEIDLVDLGYALLDKWRYLLILSLIHICPAGSPSQQADGSHSPPQAFPGQKRSG